MKNPIFLIKPAITLLFVILLVNLGIVGCSENKPIPEPTIIKKNADSVFANGTEHQNNTATKQQNNTAVDKIPKLQQEMAQVRDSYRKVIVLMWDEKQISSAHTNLILPVGQYLYEHNQHRIDALNDRLTAEMNKTSKRDFKNTPELSVFLDTLEGDPLWRDADKLVFKETIDNLTDTLENKNPQSPRGKGLLTRLREDQKALTEIQEMYADELKSVFAKLETRGMPVTREKWERYLEHLRASHNAMAIINQYRAFVSLKTPDPKTTAPKTVQSKTTDSKIESPITGMKLPPKTVILTFDDGPHHKNTSKILDVLREYQVKAIFFEVGRSVGSLKKPDLIRLKKRANISKKILADGHLLANHTMDHPALTKLGKDKIKTQLNNTSTLLNKVGQVDINLFRPPYGAINTNVQAVINEAGMKTMLWNIDSRDWADPIPSSISNRVLAQAKKHNGGIILFHDIHNRTVKSLRLVLETLKAKRYTFALHDGQRLLKPKVATSTSKGIKSRLYQKSHAVIIGINNYEKWPKLNYAVNDAVSMKELLIRSFRFEPQNVHLLLNENATRKNILSILGDGFADSKQVQADDRVLVFFAGHGTTRQLPSGRALGYIIPVDADLTSFQSQAISMTTFQDINEAITAKHIFYLMDACYGGQALLRGVGTGYDSSNYLSEITKRFTRQVLTAGGADEQVTDNGPGGHSIFTWSILEGLRGKADLNGDLHITATELFAYVGPIVSSLSHQTPAFGSLVGSEGGEFVFELGTEEEFLTDTSAQLDDEAIELNRQIAIAKNALAEKQTRNAKLKKELAAVQVQLANLGTATARGKNSTDALSKPSNAAKLRKLAMELFREKKYQESIDTYKQSHELEPTNALTTNNLGFSYFKIGELDTALKWYNKTLELAPERAVAFFNIGQLHEKNQDAPKAIEAYQRFLELAPEHKLTTRVKNKLASLEQAAN